MSDFLRSRFPALAAAIGDDYRLLGDMKAKCRCPNGSRHRDGDKHYSLLVKVGENSGSAVFRCMAGCQPAEILSSAGLRWRDVCADAPKKGYVVPQIVKTYQYHDPEGNESLQVIRLWPKAFKPRRRVPQCQGHWLYDINGGVMKRVHDQEEPSGYKWISANKPTGTPPEKGEVSVAPWFQWPYNANIIAATDRIILWHEGEGAADCTSELGFVSTTTQGGANGTVFKKEWVKLFRDRHVVLFPDHDEAGAKYVRYYLGCLAEAKAASMTVVRLPGLADKGDVKDWVFANRANPDDVGPNSTVAAKLRAIIEKASGYGRTELKKLFDDS